MATKFLWRHPFHPRQSVPFPILHLTYFSVTFPLQAATAYSVTLRFLEPTKPQRLSEFLMFPQMAPPNHSLDLFLVANGATILISFIPITVGATVAAISFNTQSRGRMQSFLHTNRRFAWFFPPEIRSLFTENQALASLGLPKNSWLGEAADC